jgi:hypothetical protein
MNTIQGISQSLNISSISATAGDNPGSIDMASAKLALDVQRTAGQELVKMMENLGKAVNIYA